MKLDFAEKGENVLIHETVVLVGTQKMRFGSDIRIDPYCVISAGEDVLIGSHVPIAQRTQTGGWPSRRGNRRGEDRFQWGFCSCPDYADVRHFHRQSVGLLVGFV